MRADFPDICTLCHGPIRSGDTIAVDSPQGREERPTGRGVMTRSRQSAKAAGTQLETDVAKCLALHLNDDRIERRARNGALDRGDIAGVRTHTGSRVVIECKSYGGRFDVGTWLNEVERERSNDGADVGLVVAKRRGTTDPLDQVVFMTVRDLVALLTGERA